MAKPIEMIYDRKHDVLYVKREDSRVRTSKEHPQFTWLVRNYDFDGEVVGVQLLNPTIPSRTTWRECSARLGLPADIRAEIDRFMEWMESGPKDPESCAIRKSISTELLDATA